MSERKHFLYFIASIAALGGFLFGFDTGVISGALLFIKRSFGTNTWIEEFIVSSAVLGALFGAFFSGRLADRFGRKNMLIAAALGFIIGTLIASLAWNAKTLIVGRFILGTAIGISSYTAPLFISEMAPAKHRGSLVLLNAIMITSGQTIAFLVDYTLAKSGSWRLMFATGLIPATFLLIGMLFSPASPRWINLKKTKQKIHTSLNTWRHLFSKKLRPVLIIGLGLGLLQQFVGINTVMYYGPFIFKAAGFYSASAQLLATFSMGLVNTIMSVVAVLLIDRLGRRKLLLSGMLVAAVSLSFVSFIFAEHFRSTSAHWATLLLMIFYIAGYCVSVGSLFWLIIAEIYPLSIRGSAMSFVTSVQWFGNFIIASTFLSILGNFGPAITFMLYAMMCIIALGFFYYFVPETNGKSLEELEASLDSHIA